MNTDASTPQLSQADLMQLIDRVAAPLMMTKEQARNFIGMTEKPFREIVQAGEISPVVPTGHRQLFRRDDLVAYVQSLPTKKLSGD